MNARLLSGILLGVAFLAASATINALSFSEMVGSVIGIFFYLRASAVRSRLKLWASATTGAILTGLLVTFAVAVSASASADALASLFGSVLGGGLFAGIPMAACAELILTGEAQVRRCPFCTKRLPVEATVCRFCHSTLEPAKARPPFGSAA